MFLRDHVTLLLGAKVENIMKKALFMLFLLFFFFFFAILVERVVTKAQTRNSFGPRYCFLGLLSHFLCKSLVIEGLISKQFSQTIRVFF